MDNYHSLRSKIERFEKIVRERVTEIDKKKKFIEIKANSIEKVATHLNLLQQEKANAARELANLQSKLIDEEIILEALRNNLRNMTDKISAPIQVNFIHHNLFNN